LKATPCIAEASITEELGAGNLHAGIAVKLGSGHEALCLKAEGVYLSEYNPKKWNIISLFLTLLSQYFDMIASLAA
jgi:hypothetical protein